MAVRTGVLILNYNGAGKAVESLRALLCVPARVVVCDNDSPDDSWRVLTGWSGRWDKGRSLPAGECAAWGAREGLEYCGPGFSLTLLRSAQNLGFAGGCNVGLRYLLACPEIDRVWLLNNDTVVHPAALDFLSRALDAPTKDLPWGAACGPVLYHPATQAGRTARAVVQAYGGGRYFPALGSSFLNGNGREYTPEDARRAAHRRLDFPLGASVLVSRAFLESVGLLEERFFLYFEEIDWMLRARGRFALTYTPHALVWHWEGAACNAGMRTGEKSESADYHFQRSRLLCARKHFPALFPLVLATLFVSAARRVMRGQWRRLSMLRRCAMEVCRGI
jgi:GT2 family glycosyltransferase